MPFGSLQEGEFEVLEQLIVNGAGVQIDTTVQWVLGGVASQEVSSFLRHQFFISTASIPLGYAEGETSIIIKALRLTAYSLRFAALRSGFRQQGSLAVRLLEGQSSTAYLDRA